MAPFNETYTEKLTQEIKDTAAMFDFEGIHFVLKDLIPDTMRQEWYDFSGDLPSEGDGIDTEQEILAQFYNRFAKPLLMRDCDGQYFSLQRTFFEIDPKDGSYNQLLSLSSQDFMEMVGVWNIDALVKQHPMDLRVININSSVDNIFQYLKENIDPENIDQVVLLNSFGKYYWISKLPVEKIREIPWVMDVYKVFISQPGSGLSEEERNHILASLESVEE